MTPRELREGVRAGTIKESDRCFDGELSRLRRRSYCHTVQVKQLRFGDRIARTDLVEEGTTQFAFLHIIQRYEVVMATVRLLHGLGQCLPACLLCLNLPQQRDHLSH